MTYMATILGTREEFPDLCLSHTAHRERLYDLAEKDMRARLRRLRDAGKLQSTSPPLRVTKAGHDEWWRVAFGYDERQLYELRGILATAYQRLQRRPWARKERKRVLCEYIRIDCMLTVGHGLSTSWR